MVDYLTVVRDVEEAISNDRTRIVSSYRSHDRYSEECNFSQALHYLFVRYVPTVSYSRGYTLRTCIIELLNYIVTFEANNDPTQCLSRTR